MAVGSITVDLLAKTGSFETDLNRAARLSEQRSKEIAKNFSDIGTAVGLGVAGAVTALAAVGTQAVDQLATLDDLTQKTGASVERLSQIQQTATAFGQDFGEIDSAISRLAKGMATVDSETNKTQKALAALGLSARDAGGALKDPAELLVQVSKALQQYEDGAAKAALVTDLFGKSGANLLPFLNDLSENVDTFTGASKEAAAEAAAFQDRLNRMKAEFQALSQSITADILPSLNKFLDTIRTIQKTSITGWLFSSADDTNDPGKRLKEIDGQLQSIAKQREELADSPSWLGIDEKGLKLSESLLRNQKSYLLGLQQQKALENTPGTKDQVERMAASGAGRSVLDYTTGNAPKEPAAKKTQYDRDLQAAQKLIESLKTQAATFGESEAAALKYKLTLQGLPQTIIDTAVGLQQQVTDMTDAKKFTDDLEQEYDRQVQARQDAAMQIAQSLETQEQVENDSYNRRIEALRAYGADSAAAQAEANQLIEAENDRHAVALATIQQSQIDQKNSFFTAQQSSDAQLLGQAAGVADQLYSILEQSGQQNSALGIALFAGMKALQVAQVIVQTEVAAAMVQAGLTAAAAQTAALAGPAGHAVLAAGIASATAQATLTRAIGYASAGVIAGLAVAGQRANGGPVEAGKQYIVGERGREAFIPNTSGTIVPNHVLEGSGGKENLTIVNNTTGRIDSAHVQQISAKERAIIIDEARNAVAADLNNPNSRMSRSMQRNTNVQRSRA